MIRFIAVLCCSVLPRLIPSGGITDNLWIAQIAFEASGGKEMFLQHSSLDQLGTDIPVSSLGNLPDLSALPSGQCHQEFTNMSEFLCIKDNVSGTETAWVNLLLGHFLSGTGAENIVFPVNHPVCDFIKPAIIVKVAANAYLDYISLGGQGEFHIKPTFAKCLMAETSKHFSPITLPQFVGSADIYIETTHRDQVLFRIFNVSSITSGTFGKEIFSNHQWPKSIVRDACDSVQRPCSNVMQLFQFTMSRLELMQIAGVKTPIP